jgi:hypothetical protein
LLCSVVCVRRNGVIGPVGRGACCHRCCHGIRSGLSLSLFATATPAAAEIDGDELAPWLEPLIALAGEIGSTVAFEAIVSGADGFYRPKTKRSSSRPRTRRTGASRRWSTSSRTRSCAPTARTAIPSSTGPPRSW